MIMIRSLALPATIGCARSMYPAATHRAHDLISACRRARASTTIRLK